MKEEDKNLEEIIDFDELDELPDVVLGDKTRAIRTLHENGEIVNGRLSSDNRAKIAEMLGETSPEETSEIATDDENEIPPSIIDDDPAVDDELSDVYEEPEKTEEQHTDLDRELEEALRQNDEKTATEVVSHPAVREVEDKSYSFDEDDAKKRRKKPVPVLKIVLRALLVVLLAALGYGVWNIVDSLNPVTKTSEEVVFEVQSGETLKTVCTSLEENGIIKNEQVAYLYARAKKLTNVKQGLFSLDKSWSLEKIFTNLTDDTAAHQNSVSATITEADWAKNAAKTLSAKTGITEQEFLDLWNNRDWISSLREEYPFITDEMFSDQVRIYLEGYLAPNTYLFNENTNAEEVTRTILNETNKVYEKYADLFAQSAYSVHQIYTLASIVQYEAGGVSMEDMKHVAGILYNRLSQGMPLQCSATVCYAIDFDQDNDHWMACEANPNFDSPYNTYMYAGLVPGPIQSVGTQAIEAVLDPMQTNDLYFMSDVFGEKADGAMFYAETLDQHNQNVANAKAS